MKDEEIFGILYSLGKYLKAAPLTKHEKERVRSEFEKSSGSILEKAYTALENVFHTKNSVILEERKRPPEVKELLEKLQQAS